MRPPVLLVGLGFAVLLAGCASDDRQWMKIGQNYTREDFRRDVESCTVSGGKLDEACMRGRGWVSVAPPKSDKQTTPDNYRARPGVATPTGSVGRY